MTYYSSAWIHVIVGSLAIAVGGYLTTRGWNLFNSHAERKSLVAAAFWEWQQNQTYLALMQQHACDPEALKKAILLSRFHDHALQRVLTSHLFAHGTEPQARVLKDVSSYLLNLNPVNDSISKLNLVISGDVGAKKREEVLLGFYNSKLLQRFTDRHEGLGKELSHLHKQG